MGEVRNEQYVAMVERDSTTINNMQNTNGEIPDVAGYGDVVVLILLVLLVLFICNILIWVRETKIKYMNEVV